MYLKFKYKHKQMHIRLVISNIVAFAFVYELFFSLNHIIDCSRFDVAIGCI